MESTTREPRGYPRIPAATPNAETPSLKILTTPDFPQKHKRRQITKSSIAPIETRARRTDAERCFRWPRGLWGVTGGCHPPRGGLSGPEWMLSKPPSALGRGRGDTGGLKGKARQRRRGTRSLRTKNPGCASPAGHIGRATGTSTQGGHAAKPFPDWKAFPATQRPGRTSGPTSAASGGQTHRPAWC